MQHDPFKPLDHLMGGIVGTIFLLVVIASILPIIFGYVVALIVLVMVARVVWYLTR